MGLFTLVLLVLWILKLLFLNDSLRRILPSAVVFTADLLGPILAVPAIYYSLRLFSIIRRKLLWKIRRRLILAHIFIGAVPVVLVIIIVYIASMLFYYQISHYLISNQIASHAARVHSLNLSLSKALRESTAGLSTPSSLKTALDRDAGYVLGAYPSAGIILRTISSRTEQVFVFGNGRLDPDKLEEYQIPWWLGGQEFKGLVVENVHPDLYLAPPRTQDRNKLNHLFIRSLVLSNEKSPLPFSVEVSVPFDRRLLDHLKTAIGQDLLLASNVSESRLNAMLQNTDILKQNIICSTFDSEVERQTLNRPLWSIVLFPFSWSAGSEISSSESDVLFVELSTSKMMQNVFRSESNVGQTILGVLKFVVGFFLLVECVSLLIGVMLTKSITNAVHNLYRGTEFIRQGDFSHRIIVKFDDQLGALANSFNQMTEYIQSLIKERVQKERLERELEIAKEVQEQLFPHHAPTTERLELNGLCLPARIVSGDY
jgi:phosphoserine phosphatase RsbU/P